MVAQSQPTNYHCPAACQATKNRVILSPMDLRPLVEELGAAAQRVLGPKVAEAAGAAAANPASAAAEGPAAEAATPAAENAAAAAADPAAEAAAAAAQAFAQEAAAAAGVGTSDVKTSAEGPAADPAAAPAPDVKTSDVTTDEKQELVIRYKHMGLHTDTAAWSMTFSEQLKRTQRVQSPLSAKQSNKST
jgi:hypothetical protein